MQNKFIAAMKAAKRQKEMKLQQKQSKELQQRKLADIENQILNGAKGRNMLRVGEQSESDVSKENDGNVKENDATNNGTARKKQKFYTSSGGAFADLKEALRSLNPPEMLEIRKLEAENFKEDLALRREELELRKKDSELLHKIVVDWIEIKNSQH